MKKLNYIIIIIISFIFSNKVFSNSEILKSLDEGGKLIFIRHAIAPGGGDPENFSINDCSTQRNLSIDGINQSKLIGKFFIKNKIKIDKVLSSEWCRCKDTAKYAFNEYNTFSALNSFYSSKFAKNEKRQIQELKNYIKNWESKKNLILVTHYVVISSMLDIGVNSGEIIISNKNFEIIGSIETM